MPLKFKVLLALAVLAFLPLRAFSWAENGHRIVASIAEKRLSPTAKQAVKELLGGDSLPRVSTWMDNIKSDDAWDYMASYHYVEVADEGDYGSSEKNPKGDAVRAIIYYEDILRNKKSSKQDRGVALKVLVHLTGDIHQPLHACNSSDVCSNMMWIKWFREKANMHQVWDELLVESQKLGYTEYVAFIDHVSIGDTKAWQNTSVLDWLNESIEYRKQIYAGLRNEKGEKIYNLSYRYRFDNIGLVEQRLKQAGVRLAFFLNNIFDGKSNVDGAKIMN